MQDAAIDVPTPSHKNLWCSVTAASRFETPFYARWVDAVVEKAKALHRASPLHLVYSRSLPMVAHLAGFWCARKLRLPWIANINDPWELDFFPGAGPRRESAFIHRAQFFWLRRTLRNADLVTYPCEQLHKFHSRLAGVDHPAEIIPHIGYRSESGSTQDGCFRLVHAGKLGSSEVTARPTTSLLRGLKAFVDASADAAANTQLVLVGPEDNQTQALICELGLQRNVVSTGRVSYEDSLRYIASASACIPIEAIMDEGIFFPSKLADYLVSGKPVLALSPRQGIAADWAGRGELVCVDQGDTGAVAGALATLYSEFRQGKLNSRRPSKQLISELQGPQVAEKFLRAFRERVSGSHEQRTAVACL